MQEPICYLTVRTDTGTAARELADCFTWDEIFAVWARVSDMPVEPRFVYDRQVISIRPVDAQARAFS
jgi:hypothetical protein